MSRVHLIIVVFAIILFSNTYTSAQKKCMFVGATPGVGGKISENAGKDIDIIPKIKEWGYSVDKKHNCQDVLQYTAKDFEPYDFIFLSETVHSTQIKGPLGTIPLPMLNSDGFGSKEGGLSFYTGSGANIMGPKPIVFLEEGKDHPLAAGIAPGTVNELCTNSRAHFIYNKPTIPIIPIAAVESDKSQIMMYGIEKGTKNTTGYEIPNRVVTIGLHAFCYSTLTETSEKLFKAGIEWILAGSETSVNGIKEVNSARISLSHNFKNTSHAVTYFVPEKSRITLTVWNGLGKKVKTLVNHVKNAGEHTVALNFSGMPTGMYLFNLKAGNTSHTKKILLTQ